MNNLLNNEPVKRAQEALKKFDNSIKIKVLEKTARTAQDASIALSCEVGAIVKSLLFRAENSLRNSQNVFIAENSLINFKIHSIFSI